MIFLPALDVDDLFACMPQRHDDDGRADLLHAAARRSAPRPRAGRHIRLFVSGSAPLLAETHAEFEARTGHRILERYGMTETNMNTSNPYDGERRAGTVGLPLPGVELRVADPETGQAVAPGRDRRDRGARPQRVQGLLEHARKDRGGISRRRLLHHRRPRRRSTPTAMSRSSAAPRTSSFRAATTSTRRKSRCCSTASRASWNRPSSACRIPISARRSSPSSRRGRAQRSTRRAARRHRRPPRALQAAAPDRHRRRTAAQHDGQGAEDCAARALPGHVQSQAITPKSGTRFSERTMVKAGPIAPARRPTPADARELVRHEPAGRRDLQPGCAGVGDQPLDHRLRNAVAAVGHRHEGVVGDDVAGAGLDVGQSRMLAVRHDDEVAAALGGFLEADCRSAMSLIVIASARPPIPCGGGTAHWRTGKAG